MNKTAILLCAVLMISCGQSRSYVEYSISINVIDNFSFIPPSELKEYREDELKWSENSLFDQMFFFYLAPISPSPIKNCENLEIIVDEKKYSLNNGVNNISFIGYQGCPVNISDGKLEYVLFDLGGSPRVKVDLGPGSDLLIYGE